MKPQQIIVLVVLAVADFCVLVAGFAILLSGSRTTQVTPVAVQAAASPTPPPALSPSDTPMPPSPTPSPTGTHWPTWTPRPSATSLASRTPSPTPTPTQTSSPVPPTPKSAAATSNPPASGGGAPAPGVPAATSGPSGCEPNNRPTSGKLDALWSVVAARGDPADPSRVYVTVQILPSGGGGGYKYHIMGRDYTSGCIEVHVPMCSSTPTDIIVTAANGAQWKDTVMIEAGSNLGFRCK